MKLYTIEEQQFIIKMRKIKADGTKLYKGFVVQEAEKIGMKPELIDGLYEEIVEVVNTETDLWIKVSEKLQELSDTEWTWGWQLDIRRRVLQFVNPETRIIYSFNIDTHNGSLQSFWSKTKIKTFKGYRDLSEYNQPLVEAQPILEACSFGGTYEIRN